MFSSLLSFKSSSHFGLEGRGDGGGGGPLDGEPGSLMSSSISHTGLGDRGGRGLDRAAAILEVGEAEVAFSLLLMREAIELTPSVCVGRCVAMNVEGRVLVALFLKGLSKASFIFFTLTWPNPGRF